MGELDLIRWIRAHLGRRSDRIVVDSGDDSAVVRFGREEVLFKIDSVIDGVHFKSNEARPEEIGHKALARCMSDIAAMGCAPRFAVAAMMMPRGFSERAARRIFLGMQRTARAFKTEIVGGDISVHSGKLCITVALLGETAGRPPVRRNGAKPGDAIGVTGALGGSILGKHLRFRPRVREGLALNRRFTLHAMIDISDGLALDLGHLCEESGVGAVLYRDEIPLTPAARRVDRKPDWIHALSDGEDYELLFTIPAFEERRLKRFGLGTIIGHIRSGSGLHLQHADGRLDELSKAGWEYRLKP